MLKIRQMPRCVSDLSWAQASGETVRGERTGGLADVRLDGGSSQTVEFRHAARACSASGRERDVRGDIFHQPRAHSA
jgi:hypothetical protein